jgi:hypothetical protein
MIDTSTLSEASVVRRVTEAYRDDRAERLSVEFRQKVHLRCHPVLVRGDSPGDICENAGPAPFPAMIPSISATSLFRYWPSHSATPAGASGPRSLVAGAGD